MLLICAIAATPAAAEPFINLPESFAATKAKLAAGGQADILLLGDSLTAFDTTYTPYFRDLMQSRYGDAGAGYQGFSIFTGGGIDGTWAGNGINADPPPHHSLDGLWMSTTQNNADGFLTARNPDIQLQYLAQPGGGTFRPFHWSVPGFWLGPSIDTSAPQNEVRTWNFTVPETVPDDRVWYLVQGTGTVTILGQNNTKPDPGVRIHRAANGGWRVTNYLQRNPTFDAQLSLLDPSLVTIMLGANDSANTSAEQFKSNMNQLIDRIWATLPDADIVLISPFDLSTVDGTEDHIYQRVVVPNQEVALERGVGFINLHEFSGDYEDFWLARNYLYDGVHPSAAGGEYLGNLLYNIFVTDGISPRWEGRTVEPYRPPDPPNSSLIVPEPATAAILLLTGLRATARGRRRSCFCA